MTPFLSKIGAKLPVPHLLYIDPPGLDTCGSHMLWSRLASVYVRRESSYSEPLSHIDRYEAQLRDQTLLISVLSDKAARQ